MSDYITIQNAVKARLVDAATAVQNEVPYFVNWALRRIQNEHNFRVMRTLLEATTQASTRVLTTKPTLWKAVRGRPYYVEDAGDGKHMFSFTANREQVQKAINEDDTGLPQVLLLGEEDDTGAANIEVWPLSDGNSDYSGGQYRIKLPYWRFIADLSDNDDTNWFVENGEEYLRAMATSKAFATEYNEEKALYWEAKAMEEQAILIRTDKKMQAMTQETMQVYTGPMDPQIGF